MSLIIRAKCDNPNCGTEFSVENGGYCLSTRFEDKGAVSFNISRYHEGLSMDKNIFSYCGVGCLVVVLQRVIEEEVKK